MPETTITVDAWKCIRCPHIWKRREGEKPLRCPNCGSCYWDRERKNKTKEQDGQPTN